MTGRLGDQTRDALLPRWFETYSLLLYLTVLNLFLSPVHFLGMHQRLFLLCCRITDPRIHDPESLASSLVSCDDLFPITFVPCDDRP